jgi:hypothetical protein
MARKNRQKNRYFRKFKGEITPNFPDVQAQAAHQRRIEIEARGRDIQDLPDVVIRDRAAFCPYITCGKRQSELIIGVQACIAARCERKFRVPDTITAKDVSIRVFRSASEKAQELRDTYERQYW